MKRIGEADLRGVDALGLKKLLVRGLLVRPVNSAMVTVARRVFPDRPWLDRLPVREGVGVFRLASGETVEMVEPSREPVARELFWAKGGRRSPADQLALRFAEKFARTSRTFLDIGASAGLFSMVAGRANPECRVLAFEILPESYELLERNVLANDLLRNVRARLCGLGPEPGSLVMPLDLRGTQIPTSLSLGSVFSRGVHVPVETLDEQEVEGPVAMKIDVEGFEPLVFRGGLRFLAEHRPPIICEILPSSAEAAPAIAALLGPLGYRWARITDAGVVPERELRASDDGRDWLLTVDPAQATLP